MSSTISECSSSETQVGLTVQEVSHIAYLNLLKITHVAYLSS